MRLDDSGLIRMLGPAAAGLMLLGAAAPDPIRIGSPRVQLYYEYSGKLSPDIVAPAKFDLWNVGAGEGSAEEPASDALVTVRLRMKPSDMAVFTTKPLTIAVTNAGGKRIAARTFPAGMLLVPTAGTSWARLWLNGVQCAGRVRVEAVHGTQRTAAALNFACGE